LNDSLEIQEHPWFSGIEWQDVYDCKLQPPEGFKKTDENLQDLGQLFHSNQNAKK
jgi:hypothetical protein